MSFIHVAKKAVMKFKTYNVFIDKKYSQYVFIYEVLYDISKCHVNLSKLVM